MALDACSGSGSLKLGEALYESLLHLSPLLLPVTAHTHCSHNSTLLEKQCKFHGSFKNGMKNQTPVFKSIYKWQILSQHFASCSCYLVRGLEFQSVCFAPIDTSHLSVGLFRRLTAVSVVCSSRHSRRTDSLWMVRRTHWTSNWWVLTMLLCIHITQSPLWTWVVFTKFIILCFIDFKR